MCCLLFIYFHFVGVRLNFNLLGKRKVTVICIFVLFYIWLLPKFCQIILYIYIYICWIIITIFVAKATSIFVYIYNFPSQFGNIWSTYILQIIYPNGFVYLFLGFVVIDRNVIVTHITINYLAIKSIASLSEIRLSRFNLCS